eukprot:Skav227456  [mRNA]  locus=scaffold2491:205136:205762:+ [translate_table: standard]
MVSIHSLAVYIHEQINGTFEDIFPQLYEKVDLLEYPNSGSSTMVTMDDAAIIVEDIGAHADDLQSFLADDKNREKSVGFLVQQSEAPMPRHGWEDNLSTEELMARSKKEADGIWFKSRGQTMGFKVYSRTATFLISQDWMEKALPEFNVWYWTHMSPGFVACGGKCSAGSPPRWWNVDEENPPFINRELARTHCAGYCKMARKAEASG